MDVTVGGHTQLDGAVIASTEGDVTLDTETFDYSDIQDHDTYKNVNGSISGSIGVGGDDGKKDTSDPLDQIALLPTIEGSYENAEKEQITRATVAASNGNIDVTVRSNPDQDLSDLNTDLSKRQEITKDKKTKANIYVSGTALATIARTAKTAIKYLKEIEQSGNITSAEARKLEGVLERISEEGIDPDTLAVCGIQQGFNIFNLLISSAHASDGCVLRFGNGNSFELSATEQQIIRETQQRASAELIPGLFSQVQSLRNISNRTDEQEYALAQAEGALVQQMAYYELCSDGDNALRHSGLVPYTPEFRSFFHTAEAYSKGGDALAAQLQSINSDFHTQYTEFRKTQPELFNAMNTVLYSGNKQAVDAAFMLRGLSTNRGDTSLTNDAIKRAASAVAPTLFQSNLGGLGDNKHRAVMSTLRLAAADMTASEKAAFAKELNAYANAHADNAEANITNARIMVGVIFGAAVAVEAAPAAIAAATACMENPVCINETAIALGDMAAGDAVGGATLGVSGLTVVAKNGDNIAKAVDGVLDDIARNAINNGASDIATAQRLADDLRLASARSPFTSDGKLTPSVIAQGDEIIPAGSLGNPNIPAGFGKYQSPAFQSPSGDFKLHYYYNPTTNQVIYDLDYKVIFNHQGNWP
ncbi:hypothetical protein O4H49_20390 [Kiloniella laminariae]|uniref:Uncharacterized protein n=1 Tax=Kiloniella laminariae TaxID=454162 RepID=A0ABT4LPU4_9PROT|nr:hypothetical protein [Kiloniella laminariae]MCZ4283149.1 hypothetical protein [Kiloniella laminariae]